jgi:hypothetical protein
MQIRLWHVYSGQQSLTLGFAAVQETAGVRILHEPEGMHYPVTKARRAVDNGSHSL